MTASYTSSFAPYRLNHIPTAPFSFCDLFATRFKSYGPSDFVQSTGRPRTPTKVFFHATSPCFLLPVLAQTPFGHCGTSRLRTFIWDLQRWSLTDRRDRTCGPHVFAAGTRYFRLQRTPRHLSRTLRPPSCFIKCPVFFIPMQYLRLPPTHKLSPRTCPQSLKQSKDKSKPRY